MAERKSEAAAPRHNYTIDKNQPAKSNADVNLLEVSRQAEFAEYKINDQIPETRPPAGQHVVQILGKPSE